MGLRCLLGHEYANREVEREREERGNEVVVTYRTVETCDRCGERRVVSENKEVRPVRNPREEGVTTGLGDDGGVTPDLGETSDGDASATAAAEPGESAEPTPVSDGVDAPESAGVEATAEAEPEPEPDSPTADADAGEDVDDAIILDDDPDEGAAGRGHGEWPESEETEEVERGGEDPDADANAVDETVDDGATVVSGDDGWPEPEGEDEGFDAEPGDGEPTEVSFGGGLAPERTDGAADGETSAAAAANGSAGGTVAGKQFVAAEEVEPVGEDGSGETEFFCPNCGHARDAGGSSMRAGDICPDCHKGYIAERDR